MIKGLHADLDCTAIADRIIREGCIFVARSYRSAHFSKCLTPAEATALAEMGLTLVAVFDDGPAGDDYFTHARGVKDATAACRQAQKLRQPPGSAIYFRVGHDASPIAINCNIKAYFRGLLEGLSMCEAEGAPAYAVGVYGSGAVCLAIARAGLASYTWLAKAPGWLGYTDYVGWTIEEGEPVEGLGVSLAAARHAFGGFQIKLEEKALLF